MRDAAMTTYEHDENHPRTVELHTPEHVGERTYDLRFKADVDSVEDGAE